MNLNIFVSQRVQAITCCDVTLSLTKRGQLKLLHDSDWVHSSCQVALSIELII